LVVVALVVVVEGLSGSDPTTPTRAMTTIG
jgi:hypothetical protein